MKAVVIMPTYNEAENLPPMVEQLFSLGIEGLHLLVIDDNSPDGTGQLAEDLARQHPGYIEVVHRSGKLGLGTAYLLGFQRALDRGADYIIEMDADFSHPPQAVPMMLEKIKDYDVVIGSRYAPGGSVDERWGLRRRLLSSGGNWYARRVTGLPVHDATGGFKCFRRQALADLDLSRVKSDGYAFQVEVNYACHRKGYRMLEVPIHFQERIHGQSKMSLGIIVEAAWRVWEMRGRY